MAGKAVKVRGADRLESTLGTFARDLARNRATLEAAARRVADRARAAAPRGATGRLASSIRTEVDDDSASVIASARYAKAHNWGTGPRRGKRGPHNIPRTEFLSGALTDSEPGIYYEFAKATNRKLSKVKGA